MEPSLFYLLTLGWCLWRVLKYARGRAAWRESHVSRECLAKLNQDDWEDHPRIVAYVRPIRRELYVSPLGKEKVS